jgi:hypothetical protein
VQDNSSLIAAVGDKKDGKEPTPTLIPFAFDEYVIGVGGAEIGASPSQIFYWSGGGTSSFMDIVAAAKDITTLSGDSYTSYNSAFSSTHAASAIVGGVVSLLKTQNTSLSYDDIEHILENTAVDIEGAGKDDETGHGFLDAKAALDYINTNDFVRKRAQKSEMQTVSDNEINTSHDYVMGDGYLVYKPSQWATATYELTGKLHKYVGRIEFEYVFSSPPDVWLRNSSSGTEVRTVPYYYPASIQYYDEFGTKEIKVLSVDEFGFTFEFKYWKIDFHKQPTDQYIGTIDVPNMDNIHIDYTAVGNETGYLNEPPSPPSNLSITNLGNWGNPNIDWDDNQELNIDYYEVWRQQKRLSDSYIFQSVLIASPTSSSFTDPFVIMDGQSHPNDWRYAVKAVNIFGKRSAMYYTEWINGNTPFKKRPEISEALPEDFAINYNYPNPFNPTTKIMCELPEAADVTIKVFNIMGQEVATLVNTSLGAGFHEVTFDAGGFSSGMYIARIRAVGNFGEVFTKELKMQLIK